MAFGAHEEVGHGGHFLGAAHTMERFRTCFYRPMLSSSDNYERWMRNGAKDTATRAGEIYKKKLEEYEPPPIDDAVREELEAYVVASPRGARRLSGSCHDLAPIEPLGRLRPHPRLPRPPGHRARRRDVPHASTAATSARASSSATSDTAASSCGSTSRRRGRPTPRPSAPRSRPSAGASTWTYELWAAQAPYRTLIMVSKQLHCLNDLLFRTATGDAADRGAGWWSPTTATPSRW